MSPRPIVFVDTETTSLGRLARPWEIAIVYRHMSTVDGDRPADTEYLWTVDYTPLGLPPGTTPEALEIGGWNVRGRGMARWDYWRSLGVTADGEEPENLRVAAGPEWTIARSVHQVLDGAVLVGVGVHFDAAVLSAMFSRHGLPEEPWHYAILDLKAATWGALSDRARVVPLPMRSEQLAAELEVVPPSDDERHTALGDARWAARWYDALVLDEQHPR